MIKRSFCVLVLSALVGMCQPILAATTGTATTKPVVQSKTPSDAQIERKIKEKLGKSKLRSDHFTVTVHNGVVTIEGNSSVIQHKGAMTRMARTSGAVAVQNNIRISDEARAKAAARLAKNKPTAAVPTASIKTIGRPN